MDINVITEKDELVKVDLHIHTPASKCYKGAKTDDEYIEILRKCKEMNVKIIAITDHNTLSGYDKLIEIRHQLSEKLSVLEEFADSSTKVNEAVRQHREKLKFFDEITILPGVEITLNPGIHMIVISDPQYRNDILELLDSLGYSVDKRGADSDISIDVDVKVFLGNKLLNNKIVIAPHVDSDKGIFQVLTGQYRADIFRSPTIDALTCNTISQQQRLKDLLSNDKFYKRERQMAFINSSDAHSTDEIGSKFSYIKLKTKSLNDIKLALANPEENISDFNDNSVNATIKQIVDNKKPFLLQYIEGDEVFLTHNICACLNHNCKYLLLGVGNKNYELIGVKKPKEELEKDIRNALLKIRSNVQQLGYSIRMETMGNGRIIAIIYMEQEVNSLWYMSETKEVFIWDNTGNTKVASISEIEDLVKCNTLIELQKLENKNNNTINDMVVKMSSLKNAIDKFKLIQVIDFMSIPIMSIFSSETIQSHYDGIKLVEDATCNGKSEGNIYFVEKKDVRLVDAVLRYTCPVTTVGEDELKRYTLVKGGRIVLCQNGGAHIIDNDDYYICGVIDDFCLLRLDDCAIEDFSLYGILGWLKSSVLIWYSLKKTDSTNLYSDSVLKKIVIPTLDCLKPNGEVEKLVKLIMEKENEFLKINQTFCDECELCSDGDCKMVKIAREHNKNILQYSKQIDKIIMNELYIPDNYYQLICNDFTAGSIYNILQ